MHKQGRYVEAEPLYTMALAGYETVLGLEHPETLKSVMSLGSLYSEVGRYNEAEPLYQRALASNETALGPEHPLTLRSVNNLAELYRKQGRPGEAEPLYRRALAGQEKTLGREHPDTLGSAHNLAAHHFERGDWQRAAELWRRNTSVIAQHVQRGALGSALTAATRSEAEQSEWQFTALVKAEYRLTPEGQARDAASAAEMFRTAQWAHGSGAALSLAQMAARGAKGDPPWHGWYASARIRPMSGKDARSGKPRLSARTRACAIPRRKPETSSAGAQSTSVLPKSIRC